MKRTNRPKKNSMPLLGCVATTMIAVAMTGNLFAQTEQKNFDPPSHTRVENFPMNPKLPSLFIIGDSTVRNGRGKGDGGQWGWGDEIAPYFNTNKINVVNRALGGTSSRTFYRDQWPHTLALLKPGDFVIMQFGHNDASPVNESVLNSHARSRGTIKGAGDETESITNIITKKFEVVHSFGWYEKQMIVEAREKGATPMVCSLIPRNTWRDGRVVLNKSNYAGWAGEAAKAENAPFLDINEIIGREYDKLGEENVKPLFVVGAGPHTSLAGAETNAMCVVAALKGLKHDALATYFSAKAKDVAPADLSQPEAGNPAKENK
ncbi:MAG TPA: GDSL-type esterase/lipase family protein [Verrucomicrobiae bacterium]|nr:GDSL-type esterase/lipase family protein [Verrucomicrobiae bacterium]